jgi:hypothetical protein
MLIPCPRDLFETVQSPLELINIVWMLMVFKSGRLRYIDLFINVLV